MEVNWLKNNGKPWERWELILLGCQPPIESRILSVARILKRSPKAVKHMLAKLYWSDNKLEEYADKFPKMAEHYNKILEAKHTCEIDIDNIMALRSKL